MISTNSLSVFLLHHHLNGLKNENLCLVQEVMRVSEPVADKFNNVYGDFLNLAIPTKSSTPEEVQLTFSHVAVAKKSLVESVAPFVLAGDLSSPSVISFNIEIAFATDGKKICLPITDVLLHAAAGDLTRSKKQRDWNSRNTILLPPFLTEDSILHGESDAGKLMKIFARSITDWVSDADLSSKADEASDDDIVVTIKAAETKNPDKAKQASAETAAAETKNTGKAK